MKGCLSIEAIGHDLYSKMKLWSGVMDDMMPGMAKATIGELRMYRRWGCWEIDRAGMPTAHVHGRIDYSQSNSKGSRGVRIFYELESGKRYLVRSPRSWKRTEEFICSVSEQGEIIRE